MADDARTLLRSVLDDLRRPETFPERADAATQDAWADRMEAEAELAGLITTALAPGRIDRQTLVHAQALIKEAGTQVDAERLAAALQVLGQAV